jgi:hypothetical protein
MKRNICFAALLVFLSAAGCQTVPDRNSLPVLGSKKEMAQAVGQVADALTGQELTEEQKRKLTKDIQSDKDTQSALNVIADAMDLKKVVIKYCPVDGQRYNPSVETCPVHKVKLEELTD